MPSTNPTDAPERAADAATASRWKNRKVVAVSLACYGVMLGLAFASPELYRIFCQVTGFAGTTQRADSAPETVGEKRVTIRLDSTVRSGLAWSVKPVGRTHEVQVGETKVAFYRAKNTSDRTVVGTASFNVTPDAAGAYFNKIECFCFTQQVLKPGQEVDMPVSFFVDPEFATDKDTRRLSTVTLSYTFFPVDTEEEPVARAEDRKAAAPAPVKPAG